MTRKKKADEQLSRILPEYQEKVREALNREMREAEKDTAENEMLAYLRQRLSEFEQGDYIQPDGRPSTTPVNLGQVYDKGLAPMVQDVKEGSPEQQQERRRTYTKLAVFVAVVALFGFLAVYNRPGRVAQAVETLEGATLALVEESGATAEPSPSPTPALPTGADDALQTIGGLGGSLTLGRPSALEIRYQATEKVIALPIDPARVSNRGELPYNAAVMASDNPVAVWVFGTVLNYAIGLPEKVVADLLPGDRLRLTSDTGYALAFVVTQTETKANHEAAGLLSQNRVGMTLFALPASSAEAVPIVQAAYDLTGEDAQTAVYREMGEPFFAGGDLQITDVVYSDSRSGELLVEITGAGQGAGLLSLHGQSHQTTAVPLPAEVTWQLRFALPANSGGEG
ncbi:MAG: hypothetical protein IPM39_26075 [Chloroflexi bacterium]|nr:hypothetical protein [Chloroflexota bacterium]